jgi:copper chaperone CopZ
MQTQPQTPKSAVLVLGSADPANTGRAALTLPGVSSVTADPNRGQLVIRYDPNKVEAQHIRRAVRPELEFDARHVCVLLRAWPKLAKAFPAAASLL